MDTYVLLSFIILLIIALCISLYLMFKYKSDKRTISNKLMIYEDNKNKDKDIFDDYITKIKYELQGGHQLRSGFIEQVLISGKDTDDEYPFNVIVEVKETKRTLKRSKIEVISLKIIGKSDQSIMSLNSAKDFYDGWVSSSNVEWMEVFDGREETINDILKEIEEDESIN